MKRANFYIDGYNLYHGICAAKDKTLLWLDLFAMCKAALGPNEKLHRLYFFTSLPASHLPSYHRHISFMNLLINLDQENQLTIIHGRQGKAERRCRRVECNGKFARFTEEKEIDVAIGTVMVRDAIKGCVDSIYLISADSDLNPALKIISEEDQKIKISVLCPPFRFGRNIYNQNVSISFMTPALLAPYRAPKLLSFKTRGTIQMPEIWEHDSDVRPYLPEQLSSIRLQSKKKRYIPPVW